MRIVCWIPKATNSYSEYVILIAFPLQQWYQERLSVLRYTYTACVVHIKQGHSSALNGTISITALLPTFRWPLHSWICCTAWHFVYLRWTSALCLVCLLLRGTVWQRCLLTVTVCASTRMIVVTVLHLRMSTKEGYITYKQTIQTMYV